jgi:hypothetical protein
MIITVGQLPPSAGESMGCLMTTAISPSGANVSHTVSHFGGVESGGERSSVG